VKKDAVQQHQTIAFGVYPNPVSETLFIALNGADKGNVVLSDMSGKVLGVYNVAETRSINMRNLSAGVYFATFTDGINRITQRVVRD
jgi:23S rRNA U2552 (ribose-2'-O)-methylase RlmE/FtsJ